MAANTDDELGGALYTRVLESEPCTLTDLQSVPGVGKNSMEQITQMMVNMCQIGIVYKLPNNSYVLAENADKYTAVTCEQSPQQQQQQQKQISLPLYEGKKHPVSASVPVYSSAPLPGEQSKPDLRSTENSASRAVVAQSQAVAVTCEQSPQQQQQKQISLPLYEGKKHPVSASVPVYSSAPLPGEQSKPDLRSTENSASRAVAVQSQAVVQRSQQTTVATASRTYDCDADQVVIIKEKLKKIMDVLLPGSPPIHASKVAQSSGLGNSKSVVNRELHFLKNNGVLECHGKAYWSCKQQLIDEELTVCAADLAKQPPSKKGSSGQLAQQNQPPSDGTSANDCPCPNRGGNCNHFHLHQTNTHYHQNIQIGEGSKLYFQGNGATGKRDS